MKLKLKHLTEKLKAAVRGASMSSRVLFILTAVSGALWLIFRLEETYFLLAGLMGVLWLSSIALHHVRSRNIPRHNPFNILLAACAVLFIISMVIGESKDQAIYDDQLEPYNQFTEALAQELNEHGTDIINQEEVFLTSFSEYAMQGVQYNLIITDEKDQVVWALNSWRSSAGGTVKPLLKGEGGEPVLLLDEKQQVVGTAYADRSWLDARFLPTQSSLTRGETISDELYDRYFPDFGRAIDYHMYRLATENLMVSAHGMLDSVHIDEGNNSAVGVEYNYVPLQLWNGDTVVGCDFSAGESPYSIASLVSELNGLTPEKREELKEYAAWYSELIDSMAHSGSHGDQPVYIRMIKNTDGTANAYLIYERNNHKLNPMIEQYSQDRMNSRFYSYFALCMIPAAIVFLAFWVFVDAKQRGKARPVLWAVLTLIGNVVTWIIYMLVRPQMAVGMSGQKMPRGSCPICGTKLRNDFIACPGCGILIRNKCRNCGRALENDWSFCPYCTSAVVKELPQGSGPSEETSATDRPAESAASDSE